MREGLASRLGPQSHQRQQVIWQPDASTAQWWRQAVVHDWRGRRHLSLSAAIFQRFPADVSAVHDLDTVPQAQLTRAGQPIDQNLSSGTFWRGASTEPEAYWFSRSGSAQYRAHTQTQAAWPALAAWSGQQQVSWVREQAQWSVAGLTQSGTGEGLQWQDQSRWPSPATVSVLARRVEGGPDLCFQAFGHVLNAPWQAREPIPIAGAQLLVAGRTYVFDQRTPVWPLPLSRLDAHRWEVTLVNKTHRLTVVADGGNPRLLPWLTVRDEGSTGGWRQTRMTPFAALSLTLTAHQQKRPELELRARSCWLSISELARGAKPRSTILPS